jgi:hypothetical protein
MSSDPATSDAGARRPAGQINFIWTTRLKMDFFDGNSTHVYCVTASLEDDQLYFLSPRETGVKSYKK